MPNGKRELRKRLRKLELEHAQLRSFVVKLNEETYNLDQRILALLFLIDAVLVHSGGGRRRFEAVFEEAATADKRIVSPFPAFC